MSLRLFIRPRRFWRYLKPENIIGSFMGYANCECGENFWRHSNNPGVNTSNHGGRIICNGCFKAYEKEILELNHKIMSEPKYERIGPETWSVTCGCCSDIKCNYHTQDLRFTWVQGSWQLTQSAHDELKRKEWLRFNGFEND